jgi:MOSC domain-containing protein YiiM
MVKRFLDSRRTGFYLAVSREGDVGAGDEIKEISRDPQGVSVADITRLYIEKRYSAADIELLQRALTVEALPNGWKDYFRERSQTARA